jgi:hypothetical protein
MWHFIAFLPSRTPLNACTTLLSGPECRVQCEVDGVCTCPLWKISFSSEAFEDNELLNAWPLHVDQSGCGCDSPGSSWKPPPSSELLSLGASASYLSLSQTSSDIRCRDRNLALCRKIITDFLLRNEYLVWLIITHLKLVVTNETPDFSALLGSTF